MRVAEGPQRQPLTKRKAGGSTFSTNERSHSDKLRGTTAGPIPSVRTGSGNCFRVTGHPGVRKQAPAPRLEFHRPVDGQYLLHVNVSSVQLLTVIRLACNARS